MGTEFDFVKVLDFGLVKVRSSGDQQTHLTREGAFTGTPAFMPPEIALGKPDIDGRADLYSLGCVGYWLLTGQLVFDSESTMAIVLAHVRDRPVPPSHRTGVGIPEQLERVILHCLEKNPAHRPENARELLNQLSACAGVEPWTQQQAEQWWSVHVTENWRERVMQAAADDDETVRTSAGISVRPTSQGT
jgi:serine/threonine-protein kinase